MNLENKENTSLENVGNTKSLNPKALLAFEEEETKETEIDRNEFKKERESHWKERAEQLINERGE